MIHMDMYEVLNNACDKIDYNEVANMDYDTLEKDLINLGLFKDSKSIKLFLATEAINCIYNQEYSHPITFTEKDVDITEEEKYINEISLTDNYIENDL